VTTLSRRDLLRLAAAGAAAPLVPRGVAEASAPAVPLAAGRFFTAAEMALVDELSELIIPADEHSGGARAAGVAAYVDGRLAEYDPAIPELRESQEQWRAGLLAVDALSRQATAKAFLEASVDERNALLSRLAVAETDPKTPEQSFFVELKDWTAHGYYTSKIGIHDEIEYKGNTLQGEFAGIDVATLPPVKPVGD
jgi:gluconate 2-dehydrogenase gamma chain